MKLVHYNHNAGRGKRGEQVQQVRGKYAKVRGLRLGGGGGGEGGGGGGWRGNL